MLRFLSGRLAVWGYCSLIMTVIVLIWLFQSPMGTDMVLILSAFFLWFSIIDAFFSGREMCDGDDRLFSDFIVRTTVRFLCYAALFSNSILTSERWPWAGETLKYAMFCIAARCVYFWYTADDDGQPVAPDMFVRGRMRIDVHKTTRVSAVVRRREQRQSDKQNDSTLE